MDFLQNPINPALQGAAVMTDGWDPVEAYFECITTCSLEDGECVTQCVERLRSDTEARD
jgi:hypothetical protein